MFIDSIIDMPSLIENTQKYLQRNMPEKVHNDANSPNDNLNTIFDRD